MDEIDSDNKLMVLLQKVMPLSNFDDYQSFPKWRIREMVAFYHAEAEEGRYHNYVAMGIINVFNDLMKDIGGTSSSD